LSTKPYFEIPTGSPSVGLDAGVYRNLAQFIAFSRRVWRPPWYQQLSVESCWSSNRVCAAHRARFESKHQIMLLSINIWQSCMFTAFTGRSRIQ